VTSVGITLEDAMALKSSGSAFAIWDALPVQDEPDETATGEPAAIMSGAEGEEGDDRASD
jgi:hypothetical protein